MAEALYRKYRPSTFHDIVGQDHIERTLQNAIEQNKVSHAYLFCGPRGTGKTTTARILAKALLCEKGPTIDPDGTCQECEAIANGTHPDVYELDAASRTGVENVREEIISRVHYAPTRGSVKVYIIDEVHMLSTAAFNALLKTLEEPPEHVIFILCTTDPQKVPETIHSRCQRFDFHRISVDTIVSRLGAVCMQESVEFEPEALELIAYRADGGMRNALTSLEQLIAFGEGKVTLSGAQNLLGSLDDSGLAEIVSAIGMRDVASCFMWTARYVETGADLAQFVLDLTEHVRNLYLLCVTKGDIELAVPDSSRESMMAELKFFSQDRLSRLLGILDEVIKELRVSSNPRLSFEIALTRMVRPESDITLEALAERIEMLEKRLSGKIDPQSYVGVPVVQAKGSVQKAASFSPAVAPAPQSVSQPSAAERSVQDSAVSVTAPVSAPASAPAPVVAPAPASAQAATPAPVSPQAPAAPASLSVQAPSASSTTPQSMSSQPAPFQAQNTTSAVDLSNPANVQRMWHAIVSHLRKANPARGVLFMNARVSAAENNSTLLVEFSADSGFAYAAAQKPEVQDLLRTSIQAVVGSPVPFRLELAGDASAFQQSPAVSLQGGFAPQHAAAGMPQNSPESQHKAAGMPQEHFVSQHNAAGRSQQTFVPQQKAVDTPQRDVISEQNPQQNPAAPQERRVAQHPNTSPLERTEQSLSTEVVSVLAEDDRVPLDVYESTLPEKQFSPPESDIESTERFASHLAGQAPSEPTPSPASSSEAEEIKSILTASFGEGIKFEEVHE